MILKIKPNVNINEPINFVNIISDDNCISNTQFNIDVFENSKLHIRQYFLGSSNSKDGFINHLNQVSLKSRSSLIIDKFQDLNQNFNFCNEFIDQDEKSEFIMNTFSASGVILRNDVFNHIENLAIGQINQVYFPNNCLCEDGFLDIEKAKSITCSGLDSYHSTSRLSRLKYAKPNIETAHAKLGYIEK